MLDRIFRLSEHRTTARREVLAGLTTFLTMAYILFVQPAILSTDFDGNPTGLERDAVLLATVVASALATLIMGLYARYPIALAPGMGQNVFFVTVVMAIAAEGVQQAWQVALGIVLVSGVIFLLLSLLGVREVILNALSPSLRNGIAVGIGLLIALIGLKNGGIIVDHPVTLVQFNQHSLLSADAAIFWIGLLVTSVLAARRVAGSILWGILTGVILASVCQKLTLPETVVGLPKHHALFAADVSGAMTLQWLPYVFVFLYMDLFDTMGTLVGVAEQAGMVQEGKLPRAKQAMTADAVGTVAGACLGTSTVTSYIESAAGVQQGGRTGLVAVTVAILFLLALPFAPLIGVVGGYAPITAPALVLVGAMMAGNVTKIDWKDTSESVPAFLIMIGVPLSFSIAEGIALGLIVYPIIKVFTGGYRDVKWPIYGIAVMLLAYLVIRAGM